MTNSNTPIPATNPKFVSFEASVLYFNGMYGLPVAAYPSVQTEVLYQVKCIPENNPFSAHTTNDLLIVRLKKFREILLDEVDEVNDIIDNLMGDSGYNSLDFLTEMADWLGDIQVYCASEMARLGIPLKETLEIIMQSNFSKLGEDGRPIIAEGKVQKGPLYWKPEPRIKAMLQQKRMEAGEES